MTDDNDSSDLQAIRIDGDFRWALPDEQRWVATLLMAYLDGLSDGQSMLRAPIVHARGAEIAEPPAPAAAAEIAEPPAPAAAAEDAAAAAPHGAGLRSMVEAQAQFVRSAEINRVAGHVCSTISSGTPAPRTPNPGLPAAAPSSDREVVVIWGPNAYRIVRDTLP